MKIYNAQNQLLLDVEVDDNSYRHRVIMGDHNLTLYYSLAEHVELPVGAWCEYQGETYTLERPEALKMKHTRYFEYTVTMEAAQSKAGRWKFRNPVDGRLKFPLTAKPHEHLQMFVDNMNMRDTGWSVGECIDGAEHLISYNHNYCLEALAIIASEFDTEFEIAGKRVSLHRVEYNKNNPLPLSYGRGNGFKPDIGRSNSGETPPVEILYTQGGNDNIDASKYGSSELHLPKGGSIGYDGEKFEDEDGYNGGAARHYVVDADGYSIRRSDKALSSLAEDSLDCSEIYPKRVGTVSEVVVVDAAKNFYDFMDASIPNALDYNEYSIVGETMTVIFQSGMLTGRELEVNYIHEAKSGKKARRFEVVPQEIDGQTMPNETFKPAAGDTYAVFHCTLPDSYISDGTSKSGAEWDMFRTAVKYMFDNEEQKFTFSGSLDGIWSKKDWVNIGGKIRLGGYIRFSDERFQKDGALVRITGIKDYINKPYSPELELSNETVSAGFSSEFKKVQNEDVVVEDNARKAALFTKRRFRDAKETMAMLETSLLDNFTGSVSPVTIQTMQMLVGDESLQFRFVTSKTAPVTTSHAVTWNNSERQLTSDAGIIQHMTLGISSLSSSHAASEYKFWNVERYLSGRIEDGGKKFYLYAKVPKSGQAGVFLLSEQAIRLEQVDGFYHLLVGILNSEYDGERSFVPLYGFTEVLPGRVTTDRLVSGDGQSFFDMVSDALRLGDKLSYNVDGDGLLRLRGAIVQSEGGNESYIGCYRGAYNSSYVYYNGDEVTYTLNGLTSTYRYVYSSPSQGVDPSSAAHWQVIAAGSKGADGTSVKILGSLDSDSDLPSSGKEAGDGYLIGGNLWVWNGSQWRNVGKIKGDKGDKGNDGTAAPYYEIRYAGNGSTVSAPELNRTTLNPSGWSTSQPSIPSGYYLWMTISKKSADGSVLIEQWSEPVRITPYDGKDGKNGSSPVLVFRGAYDSAATYYGNELRLDCVKSGGMFYIARIDAGEFSRIAPPNTEKWNSFGASFESVATALLLAENANIAGWVFRNNRLESENGEIYLDGKSGTVRLKGTIQHSTATRGVFSDVDIFTLPARTSPMSSTAIAMGTSSEDVGKRCLLTNNSALGSSGYYRIQIRKFGMSGNTHVAGDSEYYSIAPQETVEMTCFELPQGSDVLGYKIDYGGYWKITNRFHKDIPQLVAMGIVTNTSSGATVEGFSTAGGEFSVSRNGTGKSDGTYTVKLPSFFDKAGTLLISLTGIGVVQGGDAAVKATLISQSGRTFVVRTSDDDSDNAGSFNFVVYSFGGYYI